MMKRVTIATLVGLILGFVAWAGSRYVLAAPAPWYGAVAVVLGAVIVGCAVGISPPQPNWWLHGLLLGLILTLVPAFGVLWARMAWANEFVLVLVAGLLVGILVEFFTTVVFKATAGTPPA